MQPLGGAGAEGPDTPPRGAPGAPEPAGGGRAHGGAPGTRRSFPPAAARLEEARLDAREDAKWQRRRELMAKVKEQASSEEDENPGHPLPVQR